MKRLSTIFVGLLLLLMFCPSLMFADGIVIEYQVAQLAGNSFKYDYFLTGKFQKDQGFTIYFAANLYDNLAIVDPQPGPGIWDVILDEPNQILPKLGLYDALVLQGPFHDALNEHFSVSFDWLGIGTPGSQPVDINSWDFSTDPNGELTVLERIQTQNAVPEPASILLFGTGLVTLAALRLRRRNR